MLTVLLVILVLIISMKPQMVTQLLDYTDLQENYGFSPLVQMHSNRRRPYHNPDFWLQRVPYQTPLFYYHSQEN